MDLLETQTDVNSLLSFGAEAVTHLCSGDFRALTDWIPYALAYERSPASAVEADLGSCLARDDRLLGRDEACIVVKYFAPNDIPLFALVECRVPTRLGAVVLVELIVCGNDRKFLALEHMSVESDAAAT